MARTVMLSDGVYERLTRLKKEKNESFSEVIVELLETKKEKTGENLFKRHFGILRNDKEYDKLLIKLKKEWTAWTKEYA